MFSPAYMKTIPVSVPMRHPARWVFLLVLLFIMGTITGCMRYLTHDRSKVLLAGVDIDQTLKIGALELNKGTLGCALGVWAIRDQVVTPAQAAEISSLYFSHVCKLEQGFDVWHLTWAIADLYKNGDDSIRAVLETAYRDAKKRAAIQGGLADRFVNGDALYMGDAHSLGRRYAETHVVVPGNKKYLQSFAEYREKHHFR
jgi:hypothetical protein